jgi:hypothetical protein
LTGVLCDMPEVTQHLDSAMIRELDVPEQYLGMADEFRIRLLASAKQRTTGEPKAGRSKNRGRRNKQNKTKKK